VNRSQPRRRTIRTGTVRSYDESIGLGEVEEDDGTRYSFHATAISGGSRTIAAGTAVHFIVVFAPHGRIEADEVTPR
jgi:cold shock CspA family protein